MNDLARQQDRRAAPRRPSNAMVRLVHPARATGRAIDASASGMRVLVDYPLREGDRCIIDVRLENGEQRHHRGVVMWTRPDNGRCMAGLMFMGTATQ